MKGNIVKDIGLLQRGYATWLALGRRFAPGAMDGAELSSQTSC